MTNQDEALQRAIEFLGAAHVAPGRYAYRAEEQWYNVSAGALARAANDAERTGQPDPSACLTIGDECVAMPSWWRPEKQYAYRDKRHGVVATLHSSFPVDEWERITVDLETGNEIPVNTTTPKLKATPKVTL